MTGVDALHAHLATGSTTVARCWAVTRRDGTRLGFTDHDCDLSFDGLVFRADAGLSAKAVAQATGLSVDNTEAMGALSHSAISEADIAAGRYDGAEVVAWLVNWLDVDARRILFRGHIGEIRRAQGAFHAELRGLTEGLNRPVGRVYQAPCSAVLGDGACQFDTSTAGYFYEGPVVPVEDGRRFGLGAVSGFEPAWFRRGKLMVLDGAAQGLTGIIKRDENGVDGTRVIDLWEPLRAIVAQGDTVRLIAGCDKQAETCRLKFNNLLNFQGFPDIPEDDWVTIHPTQAKTKSGGSRR